MLTKDELKRCYFQDWITLRCAHAWPTQKQREALWKAISKGYVIVLKNTPTGTMIRVQK